MSGSSGSMDHGSSAFKLYDCSGFILRIKNYNRNSTYITDWLAGPTNVIHVHNSGKFLLHAKYLFYY